VLDYTLGHSAEEISTRTLLKHYRSDSATVYFLWRCTSAFLYNALTWCRADHFRNIFWL